MTAEDVYSPLGQNRKIENISRRKNTQTETDRQHTTQNGICPCIKITVCLCVCLCEINKQNMGCVLSWHKAGGHPGVYGAIETCRG